MDDVSALIALDAVARFGSVTAGAAALSVSQPAISKRLKQLERRLGHALLERHGRGVRLTEAGRIAAAHARRIVAEADALPRALADLSSLRTGTLRVGATPNLGTYLLPDLLVRFRTKFPAVRLHLEVEHTPHVTARVAAGDLDLGLTESDPDTRTVDHFPFATDDLLPLVPSNHALAGRRKVTLRDFIAQPLILHTPRGDRPSTVERLLAARNHRVTPALTLPTTEAIKRAVIAGLGVAFLPALATRAERVAGTLIALSLPGPPLTRPLYRLTPKSIPESKAVTAFCCLLKHAARGTLATRPR